MIRRRHILAGSAATLTALALAIPSPAWITGADRGADAPSPQATRSDDGAYEYDLEPFDEIVIEGHFDVTVRCGQAPGLVAHVDSGIIDLLRAEVHNGRLVLDWRHPGPRSSAGELEVFVPGLTRLGVDGAADVEILDVSDAELRLEVDGAADIDAEGQVERLVVRIDGAADINAKRLVADDVEVRISGAGSADVRAEKSFDGEISGCGSIRYAGDPVQVTRRVDGVGRISAD